MCIRDRCVSPMNSSGLKFQLSNKWGGEPNFDEGQPIFQPHFLLLSLNELKRGNIKYVQCESGCACVVIT